MEVVGISSYEQDAEIIDALCTFYKRLTIPKLTVSVDSLGSKESRIQFRKSLIEYLQPLYHSLSEEKQPQDDQKEILFIVKIDIDKAQEIAHRHKITSIPTLLFFKDDAMVKQVIGLKSLQDLKEIIAQISIKIYCTRSSSESESSSSSARSSSSLSSVVTLS
ncbi:hypothetical protein ACTFIW_002988 [Dictyostelium discoideum]